MKAVGDLQRVGDDNVTQLGTALKRRVFNGCQAIGQVDAREQPVSCQARLAKNTHRGRQRDRGEIRVRERIIINLLSPIQDRIGATHIQANRVQN